VSSASVPPGPAAPSAATIDVAAALAHHLLVVPDDVAPDDVEALAMSRFPGAGAAPDGVGLAPGARLVGPWSAPRVPELGMPPWPHHVYLTHAPRQRGAAVPRELRGRGDLLDAFADGEPVGLEREVVDFLLAAARRLGGAVRVEGRFGLVLTPPPRPDLVLYSGSWLEPARLVEVLAPQLPGLAVPEAAASPRPRVPLHAPAEMDEAERRWLHAEADAYDAAALAGSGEEVPGYGATVDAEDGSVFSVAAEPVAQVPLVVTPSAWASAGAYCYEIRHHAAEPDPSATRPRGVDLRTPRAVDPVPVIDAAALALHDVVGGEVVDDDGFLVALR
jgi:hypothetical protein